MFLPERDNVWIRLILYDKDHLAFVNGTGIIKNLEVTQFNEINNGLKIYPALFP